MVGFRTKNSTYIVDLKNKTISGGNFGQTTYVYEKAVIILGAPAEIVFKNNTLRTSTVISYI